MTWRKPIEFGISGAITTLSLAWVMGRLRRSGLWDWVAALAIVSFLPETALIDLQQWRGVASHFNFRTDFDAAVFDVMAVFIGFVAIGIVIVAVRAFGRMEAAPATALAIRAGMVFLLVGQVLGGFIVANGLSADGPANASIVGAAGELKVPHALALHGLQVLAILALILERTAVSARAALIAVASCTVGYALVLAAATLQTYSGLAPLALSPLAVLLGLSGAILVAGPYLRGLVAIRRSSLA